MSVEYDLKSDICSSLARWQGDDSIPGQLCMVVIVVCLLKLGQYRIHWVLKHWSHWWWPNDVRRAQLLSSQAKNQHSCAWLLPETWCRLIAAVHLPANTKLLSTALLFFIFHFIFLLLVLGHFVCVFFRFFYFCCSFARTLMQNAKISQTLCVVKWMCECVHGNE